jgi:ATP-dependent DNA helicase RecQ
VEISRDARFIVACIEETGQRFGIHVIAETLSGELSDRVLQYRLDQTDYFGALRDLTSGEVRERIRFLLDEEILALSTGKYPVLQLTAGADEEISGGGELVMNVRKVRKTTAAKYSTVPSYGQEKLFLRLRELCGALARRQGIPSYAIFTDKTLREMAAVQPVDMTALGRISGVGETKARRYGGEFLEEIRRFRASFE